MAAIPRIAFVVFVVAAGLTMPGCQRVQYVGGIGGNLTPVEQDADGTWIFVPTDEYEAMTPEEREELHQSLKNSDNAIPNGSLENSP